MEELRGQAVVLRSLVAADAEPLREIRRTPQVERWWAPLEDDFPLGDDPDSTRFTIFHEGERAGMVQYGEEPDPGYRHAWIDIFVDPARHGRGLCTDTIRTLLRHLTEDLGHHRVTIDPAVGNDPARALLRTRGLRARRRHAACGA